MSSCRATSYYVAPGKKYDFASSTLCAREYVENSVSGRFVEFKHRKDLERYEREHPDWDKVCYVGPGGGVEVLAAALVEHPDRVARWRIDSRIVNGRAPAGAAHVLYNLGQGGVKRAGGVANVLALFEGATKPLATAVAVAAQRGDSFSLSLALGLRSRVGDDVAARIAVAGELSGYFGFAPVDTDLVVEAYDRLSERYSEARALALLSNMANSFTDRWLTGPARSKNSSPELLAWLVENGSDNTRSRVAENAVISPELAADLARDTNRAVVLRAARNPRLALDVVTGLLDSDDKSLAQSAASNQALSVEVLRTLAKDPRSHLRCGVASNKSTPPEVLEELSHDMDVMVRQRVAGNVATPAHVLGGFALSVHAETGDGLEKLARAAHLNPTTPLAAIREAEVIGAAKAYVADQSEAFRKETSPLRLGELATSTNTLTRFYAATNPRTPPEALLALSHDSDYVVQRAVGQNKSLSIDERLRVLSESTDPDSVIALALLVKQFPGHGLVPHPAWTHVEEALANGEAAALGSRVVIAWPLRPRSVRELPGRDATPWNLDEYSTELNDRPIGDGLKTRVIASNHELSVNANYMGNCTSGYGRRVVAGQSVILALVDQEGVTQYNAELAKSPMGGLEVGEVNSRFNRGDVPDDVRETLRVWAKELSAMSDNLVAAGAM